MKHSLLLTIFVTLPLGCGREYHYELRNSPAAKSYVEPAPDAHPTATVSGRVLWKDEIPNVPQINGLIRSRDGAKWGNMPNHFAPRIDPASRGLANTVVWLVGVDPKQSKPWPYPPLTVEARDFQIQLRSGEGKPSAIGFAKVGAELTLMSADAEFHSIRARGAAAFTLPFLTANVPTKRTLSQPGHVEFTSGAGYFWSTADVFVAEHPYFSVTDSQGRFQMDSVPAGEYQIVAWLRNWAVLDVDRDPETGRTMRLSFGEPFTTKARVSVKNATISLVELSLSTGSPPR